jgi:WD40 repeat protein
MTRSRYGPAFLALLLSVFNSPLWSEPPAAKMTDRLGDALPSGPVARLGSMRFRHDRPPGLLAFGPDNKTLTVLTLDRQGNTLWLWNTVTGERLRRLPVGKQAIHAAAFSADGRLLAVCAEEEFGLVDTTTGRFVRRIDLPRQRIACLALSPDGKLLAAGCAANRLDEISELILWETANGKELARLKEHKTAVDTVAFSRAGRRLFSTSAQRKGIAGSRFPDTIPAAVCVWEVDGRKLQRRFRPNGVNAVFAPDGKSMACIDEEGAICLWSLITWSERTALEGDWRSYLFTPDGETLIVGGRRAMPTMVDAATGKTVRTFSGHAGKGVRPAAISHDGKLLATLGDSVEGDTSVRLWNMATGEEFRSFAAHRESVTRLAFAPDGKTLISGSKDTTLRVWDAVSGEPRRVYEGHRAAITAVAFAPDGNLAASGDADNCIHLWGPANGKLLRRFAMAPADGKPSQSGIRCLAFSADGKTLFAGSRTVNQKRDQIKACGLFAAWDTATGASRQPGNAEDCYPVALTADGRYLASGTLNATLILRRRESSRVLSRIDAGGGGPFHSVTFSYDGQLVATHVTVWRGGWLGSSPSTSRAELWETATGKHIAWLPKIGLPLAFSPDGKFLAVHSPESNAFCLLSTVTGRVSAELAKYPGRPTCCAFSPDGRLLATGGHDGISSIWNVSGFQFDRTLGRIESTRKNAEKLWDELLNADAARAYRAVGTLASIPEHSLPLLRERLKPVASIPAATIEQTIQDLDSADFAVRERANETLEKANELAEPALRRALKANPSLELRRRVEALLDRIDALPLSADRLRLLRALPVVERIATAEAKQILTRLAGGAPGAFATEQAKVSLERLNRRRAGEP